MEENRKDIFDKIMNLPLLKIFQPFYQKHKEVLLYLFFGGVAVLLNLALFAFFNSGLKINELIANIICWVICVLFQFFTNRTWVFQAQDTPEQSFFKQILSFFGGRVFTLVIEELILFVFITLLMFNTFAVKITAQVITIVLNYIISKFFVFKK